MGKTPVDIVKYVIHAEAEAKGLIEKPDIIGAIFGQTEGLLGEDLDLRELQKSGRIGRIEANLDTKGGITKISVTVPSSLDMVETSIIAAGVETINRIGPCDATFKIKDVEDIRDAKRTIVIERAKEILKELLSKEIPDAKEIAEEVRKEVRTSDAVKYRGMDAGSNVEGSESVILVEGRADVINLLRNGIKNVVAVGGIKIPDEAIDICNKKNVTLFVDGDRGGDLILKSLEKSGAEIDYVAKAPRGREVENLTRKEIMMALRRKVAADQALAELKDMSNSNGNEVKFEKKDSSVQGVLLSKIDSMKNNGALFNRNMQIVKKFSASDIKKQKLDGYALVLDDVLTQEIVDAAKVKYIAAVTKADNLRVPDNMEIITKF